MERRLEGLDNDDVIQMPTLPESPSSPRSPCWPLVRLWAPASSCCFCVHPASAAHRQESSTEQAEKIARIRNAMPW
jgi:hypothetical protein